MIKIRFATIHDVESIIDFLKKNWNEESILVQNRKIFSFQYVIKDSCNFILAIDDDTNTIYGLKGFMYYNDEENPDIAAALAVVLQGVRPMLGMEIQKFLEKETQARMVCATGLNPNTSVKVYKLFKKDYTVGKLKHYYSLSNREKYFIPEVHRQKNIAVTKTDYELIKIKSICQLDKLFNFEIYKNNIPFKSKNYIERRYFNHPVYEYHFYGIRRMDRVQVDAVIVAREIIHLEKKALRIVDLIGKRDNIAQVGEPMQNIIKKYNYEYIDFYCYGLEDKVLEKAGLVLKDEHDVNIIPNYFEPFVKRNVDIHFFYTGNEPVVLCKADGDQDRPNRITAE